MLYRAFFIVVLLGTGNFSVMTAQVLFVDPLRGKVNAQGTPDQPLSNLDEAVQRANHFSGTEPISIKLAPGLNEPETGSTGKNYLNVSPTSDGKDIPAGIFKNTDSKRNEK